MDIDAIIAELAYDKHTLSGKPTIGLLRTIGDMYKKKAFMINQLTHIFCGSPLKSA